MDNVAQPTPSGTLPPTAPDKQPLGIRLFLFFLLLQAAIIAMNAIFAYTFNADAIALIGIPKSTIVVIATFQLLIVAAMLVVVWAMNKRFMWSYYVAIGLLLLNLVANFVSERSTLQFIVSTVLVILLVPQRPYFNVLQVPKN